MALTLADPSCIHSLQTKASKSGALGMQLLLSGIYTYLCGEFGIAGHSWCLPPLLLCPLPGSPSLHPDSTALFGPLRLPGTAVGLGGMRWRSSGDKGLGQLGPQWFPVAPNPAHGGSQAINSLTAVEAEDPGDRPSGARRVRGSPQALYI